MRGELLFAMTGHQGYVHTLAWSPDSTRLATAGVDDTVRVWDASRGTLIRVLPNKFAQGMAWSPDEQYLASGCGERVVKIWNARTLAEFGSLSTVRTLTGEATRTGAEDYIESVAWSPDGAWLAVADRGMWGGTGNNDDKTSVRIYSAKTFTAKTVSDLFEVVDQLVKVPALDVVGKRVEKEAAGSVEDARR
jgi:WD40 repeat protein